MTGRKQVRAVLTRECGHEPGAVAEAVVAALDGASRPAPDDARHGHPFAVESCCVTALPAARVLVTLVLLWDLPC